MNRRSFTYTLAGSIAAIGLQQNGIILPGKKSIKKLRPKKLKKGDKVGLISPGSPITREKLENAQRNMERLGLIPIIGENAMKEYGYLAGTDAERLADLHSMFENEQIKAVWAIRGGYGCTRLMEMIDYDMIRNNPKHLIGYSDLTALHLAIYRQTGLVCTHGPVAGTIFSHYTEKHIKQVLFKNKKIKIGLSKENIDVGKKHHLYKSVVIRAGEAMGKLTGGNLSLLASVVGTKHAPDYSNKLVFIEDVGEKPYRIDRMLTQLIQSSNLLEAKGIILGVFAGCDPDQGDKSLSLKACLKDRFFHFQGPVVYGFSFGHIKNQCSFPYGIEGKLDTEKFEVEIMW